jgi:NAD(P)-dependent dehydrogenase (short-subunit alcohol dehydrogenase family)
VPGQRPRAADDERPDRVRAKLRVLDEEGAVSTVAIITGGAGGMGLATARVIGPERHVVIGDVRADRLDEATAQLRAEGIENTPVTCDLTDRASVDALFARAAQVGDVAAVVHTAGVSPQMGSAEMIIRINALGTVHVAEASLAVATDGFALVNVASIAGHMLPGFLVPTRTYRLALTDHERFARKLVRAASRGPKSMHPGSAYSLSKAFVIWYSRMRAADFGAKGARILSVSPGSFDTDMGRLEEKAGAGKLVEYAALKRFGQPEEIAELLAFCASPKASYLTGIDILCDGGTRAGLGPRDMLTMARGQ